MNRRRFLLTSAGVFVPTIVRAIDPLMLRRIAGGAKRLPNLVFQTTKVGLFNPTLTMTGLVPIWDYGDGSPTEATKTPSHTYANAETKRVSIYLSDLPSKLTQINIEIQSLIGNFPNLTRFGNLTTLYARNNLLVAVNLDISSLTKLTVIELSTNLVSGILASLTPNTALTTFRLFTNTISGYTASTLSTGLYSTLLYNNLLPEASINQIAADFVVDLGSRPGVGTLGVGGTGNAAASGQGITDYNAIAAHGWAVTHN